MQCKIVIDPDCEERVLIYARERTPLIGEIERLVGGEMRELVGYSDNRIVKLESAELDCFTVEGGRVYAIGRERYKMKERLYEIEALVGSDFVKINQSCIVNVNRIDRFEASFAGALIVITKSGYRDSASPTPQF